MIAPRLKRGKQGGKTSQENASYPLPLALQDIFFKSPQLHTLLWAGLPRCPDGGLDGPNTAGFLAVTREIGEAD
jgi:hypothetical protein